MAKDTTIKSIERKVIALPEWCLDAFIHEPAAEEVAATVKYLVENPDVIRAPTVIENAIFSLVARDVAGVRHFTDHEIALLALRQRDVIERVLTARSDVAGALATVFYKAIGKTEKPKTGE